MAPRTRKREEGAAMFLAVMLLVLMGALGLAALDTASEDRRIAGFQNRSSAAFQAAEAGIAVAAERARANNLTVPLTNLSDVGVYDREGGALPSYRADPAATVANPNGIKRAPGVDGAAEGVPPEAGGGWKTARWQINIEGRSPNAGADLDSRMSTSRVELVYGTLTHGGSDYKGQ
ncbi:MAG: hypothetical protein ACHQ6V_06240 [Myxococcota bacterium]|jgi:hypothetical protein